MSPTSQRLAIESTETLSGDSNVISSRLQDVKSDPPVIKRHPDFARMHKPFGLEFHEFASLLITQAHIFAVYGLYLTFSGRAPWSTALFDYLFGLIGGIGITVGCHRYWTHKTFKANKPLQILLMIFQTVSLQMPIHKWSLDHRIHHKYTDTNADPHNSARGFIFSHIGWQFVPPHPEYKKKLETFDMSDLEQDPIVRFQSRWYWTLVAIFHTIIPISLLYYIWEMPLLYCIAINYRRYVMSLHCTFCVNSIAHMYEFGGTKGFDKNISSVDNRVVSFLAIGEGWHNYHHAFPWDYKAAELGWKINVSTIFIDFFAWLGWATELKTVSQKMLRDRVKRTGDGSHEYAKLPEDLDDSKDFDYRIPTDVAELLKSSTEHPIWGWDDELLPEDFRKMTKILKPDRK